MQVQRIGKAHVERRAKPQLAAHPHGEHAAVHEDGLAVGGGAFQNRLDARIVRANSRAWPGTGRWPACLVRQGAAAGGRGQRIDHGIGPETAGHGADRRGYRGFIARETGDQGGLPNALAIEFRRPGAAQSGGVFGRQLPGQRGGQILDRFARRWCPSALGPPAIRKTAREEMDVGVGDRQVTPWGVHRACSSA